MPTGPVIGRGTIRAGAIVWMDFAPWKWPEVPRGDASIVFDLREIGTDGVRVDATAAHFGAKAEYGNGGLFVKISDVLLVE
ncbi:hypothetical protein UFOVP466_83 [uncultured Caudovirales phage]|uniref:Uncharacterized protein n=1 Tax=uncultured Caudovirales phage TaxID=2100421 RepID=A0A6J5T238_9CAUD|nr:hypothetical protein UFOVP466_83 [uncultured Caudovirales phage]CAB4180450.1 hypothetical protein UFOVP1045_30 [uncultured Caudovirales phage]CAB4190655.1 hypothetical protein UFOVP1194_84 [uncultured Caudovirales phage]CAB4221843.1 hypothetical protein UFOVP1641_80 [uncultured Caudovirales phage]